MDRFIDLNILKSISRKRRLTGSFSFNYLLLTQFKYLILLSNLSLLQWLGK